MMPDTPAVRAAAEALAVVCSENPLDVLLVRWARTRWRVAVAGRAGVGKTTLVNRLVGSEVGAVGLGGVTQEPVVYRVGEVELADTPGLDDPDVARIELAPLLADADAVVWVVDGLMPAGAVERQILASAEALSHVVVSRLDLVEEADRSGVIERVRALVHAPVRAGDLRTLDLSGLLAIPKASSPRRRRALVEAVEAARASLSALPPIPSRGELLEVARTAWRREVRETEELVAEELARGLVEHKDHALRRLRLLAPHAITRFVSNWSRLLPEMEPPVMPLPPQGPRVTPLAAAVTGGQEGAQRALRAAAGAWLLDGDVVLGDHLSAVVVPDQESPRRTAALLVDALAREAAPETERH